MCKVTNINTVATAIKDDHHRSVRALATELKISWEGNRRIGNEVSVPIMGTTLPANGQNPGSFPYWH